MGSQRTPRIWGVTAKLEKKITKGKSNGVKRAKNQENVEAFSHSAKFRTSAKISHPFAKLLDFSAFSALLSFFFPSGF